MSRWFLFIPLILTISTPLKNIAHADDNSFETRAVQLDFFEKKIRPVLVQHCYRCHSSDAKNPRGGLLLDTRDGLLKGGGSGPAVVPGKTEESLLISAVRYESFEMPPKGKLPAAVIKHLETWVKMGAPDPRDGGVIAVSEVDYAAGRKFWSFQPVRNPPAPEVSDSTWTSTDIDRFVLARLDEKGLRPVPQASRQTLIRRASFDLTGLPPTPNEIEAFVNDESDEAWEKLIDRLLATAAYGERWGRHWLDVARYGEDQAHTFRARLYPQGFRYRDWTVNSFAADYPYDEFLVDQIAGDLVAAPSPDSPERLARLPALGFFGLGPVYYRDDEDSTLQAIADDLDERVDSASRGLLGLTVACARCHDHKYDPISMHDYYALSGVFASSQYEEKPIVPQAVIERKETAAKRIEEQDAVTSRFVTAETERLQPQLLSQTTDYLIAAWNTLSTIRANEDVDVKQAIAKTAGDNNLVAGTLARWVEVLKHPPDESPWTSFVAEGENIRDSAMRLQKTVVASYRRRNQLLQRYGAAIAFVKPEDRQLVPLGQIPLGNLFDDDLKQGQQDVTLAAALTSDVLDAKATDNSLGVLAIRQGWGTETDLIPEKVYFDFQNLGSSPEKYGAITNDTGAESIAIQTLGKKRDSKTRLEQGIGMHANSLITFDLDKLRAQGGLPKNQTFVLHVDRAGVNDFVFSDSSPSLYVATIAVYGDDKTQRLEGQVNGVPLKVAKEGKSFSFTGKLPPPLRADGRFVRIKMKLQGDARAVIFAVTGARVGLQKNTIRSDHAVFSGARLEWDAKSRGKMAGPTRSELDEAVLLSRLVEPEKGIATITPGALEHFLAGEKKEQLAALRRELEDRKKAYAASHIPTAHVLKEGEPANMKLNIQGDPRRLGEEVPRGFLAVFASTQQPATDTPSYPFKTTGSGRWELAQTIASANNPLTARVIVNRIWQWHFGRGLVRTASNFGQLGDRPSHPDLLDYLAGRFIKSGWSFKALHRDIMLSRVYQLSSAMDRRNFEIDGDNEYLWRMHRRRLDVEPWRDAMLAVSGSLDYSLGGPSTDLNDAANRRRTVYAKISRHRLNELLRLFDFPDPNITSAERTRTTVPLQQLFVLNSEFMIRRAKALAARLLEQSGFSDVERIERAYILVYGRPATQNELDTGRAFLRTATVVDKTASVKDTSERLTNWEQYSLALLSSNEFLFVD